jgi:hypothetical protein
MPENSGIGQLPAPNMKGMADGGIVGYDEGGPVNGVYVPDSGIPPGALIMGNTWRDPETGRSGYLPGQGPSRTGYEGMTLGDIATKAKEKLEDLFVSGTSNKQKLAQRRESAAAAAPDYHPESLYTGEAYGNVPAIPKQAVPPAVGAGSGQGTRGMPTGIDQLRAENLKAPQAAPLLTAEKPTKALSLDQFMPAGSKRPNESDVETLNKERLKGAEEALAGFNTDIAKRGPAMAGQEARIAAREATSKDRLDTNTNMSLINAGLAMMQSSGKGLAGLAEGAQVGTKQYQAGLREYDNAKEKLDTARDLIEQYRRTEDTMTDKDRRALTKDINTTRAAGLESLIGFRTKIYGEDRADARSMLDMTAKRQEGAADRENRVAIANASAAVQERIAKMPGAQERLFATLGGGDAKKGFKFYTEQAAEGKGDEALLAALVKEPMLLSNLPKDLQDVVTNTLRARLVPPTVKAPPASQVRAP